MHMKKILIDMIPVCIGILLALVINGWRETQYDKNYLKSSIEYIVLENEANIQELEYALKRQVTFMDTLSIYLDDETVTLSDVIRKVKGVYTPDLKSTTWEFLIQDSKHTLVSYAFVNKLAEIEKYENLIERYNEKVGEMIFQTGFFNDPDLKRVCYILFSDLGQTEKSFVESLKEFNEIAISEFE